MADAATLLRLLCSEDVSERVMALEGLVREYPDEACDHVSGSLGDPDPRVRAAALRAASVLELALPPEELREVLEDASDEVRIRAVQALPGLDPAHALELLEARVAREGSPKVLATLIRVLAGVGSALHASLLTPLLEHDDARVRANAVEALDALLRRSLLEPMGALDGDPSNRVRGNVVVVLSRFDVDAAARILTEMAGHEDKWFRVSAAWAAGTSRHPRLLEAVIPLLRDPEPDVQLMAIKAFADMPRYDRMLAELERIVSEDADPAVSHYARRALDSLRG